MESRTDHYLENPQQQSFKFTIWCKSLNNNLNRKRRSGVNERSLLSHETFMATSSSKGGCDSKESLIGGRTSN